MKISTGSFGRHADGSEAALITIQSAYGKACFTDYGASVVSIIVPDKDGNMDDVVLGFDNAEEYRAQGACFGAICGRFANRLAGSRAKLNGVEYNLDKNHELYTIHGGGTGFDKRVWDYHTDETGVTFSIESADGDMGFPGNLKVSVRYEFTDSGVLSIDFYALSDKDTLINLTNHAYFNLSGHASCDDRQLLQINADFFNPQAKGQLPTGEVRPVEGTVMDFRREKEVALASKSDDEQIIIAGSFDHNFLLKKSERDALEYAGSLRSGTTGISMEVYTTMPAMMIYTANSMEITGKNGAVYGNRGAVCMECQNVPDSMRHTHFPSPVLKAGEQYRGRTEYRFYAQN